MKPFNAALAAPTQWGAVDYRQNAWSSPSEGQAQLWLRQAADSIHLALLTIAHHVGEDGQERMLRRIQWVQEHLVDACKALTRSKVHVAGLWTYSPAVILDEDPDPEREIARLNRMTMTLATRNHALLPPIPKALPLSDEDEAQLALVSRDVGAQGRAHRMGLAAWAMVALLSLALLPLFGGLSLCLTVVFAAFGVSQYRQQLDRPTGRLVLAPRKG